MLDSYSVSARDLLAGHFLFDGLDDSVVDSIASLANRRRYTRGETLFLKGDPGTSLLAVISGRIRISTLSAEGKEIVLNIMEPGDVFGEIALLDGKERTADASALEASEILTIERRDFLPFVERHPTVATQMIAILCERLRWVSDQYEDMVFLHLPARLAKKIGRLSGTFDDAAADVSGTVLTLSQQELGNLTGATREAVNKVLRDWEEEGLVVLGRNRLTILDAEALETIADGF